MATIRYDVPYQVDVIATDLTSGKRVGNTLYLTTGLNSGGPLPYGGGIPGGGSTTTFLANFRTAWAALITAVLTDDYTTVSYTSRAILGWGYSTPQLPINALATGPTTLIQTATPHGLTTGQVVRIDGVSSPTAVNGLNVVTVTASTQFTVPVITTGSWGGGGSVQLAFGRQDFIYADKEVLIGADTGGLAGESLPLFADVCVRRTNSGVGKSFRSRIAMAPVSEADQAAGQLTVLRLAAWNTALATFIGAIANGGSDAAGSGNMFEIVVSRKLASTQVSPFNDRFAFTKVVNTMVAHRNLGSQNQRKPKLTPS